MSTRRRQHRTEDDQLVLDMYKRARRSPDSFARLLRGAMEHFISGQRCRITLERMPRAIIIAAEEIGEDGRGKDRLVGYLRRLACDFPRSFIPLSSLLVARPCRRKNPRTKSWIPAPAWTRWFHDILAFFFNRS